MPLFGNKASSTDRNVTPPPVDEDRPKRKSSLFNRRRSPSPGSPTRRNGKHVSPTGSQSPTRDSHRGGFFSRDRTGSGLGRGHVDPSIHAAQERVRLAERAELEADKALQAAKNAVREARDHVKRLEKEAEEEARLAKMKQGQAKSLSKSAKHLGRHDHI